MERKGRSRIRFNNTVRGRMKVQIAVASAFVLMALFITVFSLKQEQSVAGREDELIKGSRQLEVIEIRDIKSVDASNFTPFKKAEMVQEVKIEFDDLEETLDVNFGRALEKNVELRIYDMYGNFVTGDHIDPGVTSLTYSLNQLGPGVYTLKTITAEQTFTSKLVIPKEPF